MRPVPALRHVLLLPSQGAIPKGMEILAEIKPGYEEILSRSVPPVAAGESAHAGG